MSRGKGTFLALLVFLLSPITAQAIVIDFEGVIPPGEACVDPVYPYIEDGFVISGSLALEDLSSNCTNPFANGNDTTVLAWANEIDVPLASIDGSPFRLYSLDLASGDYPDGITDFGITGFLSGGGTIEAFIPGGATGGDTTVWDTYVLDWKNLDRVTIRNSLGTGVVDNIVVYVPEPGTLLLLGIGLLGMGLARRKTNA